MAMAEAKEMARGGDKAKIEMKTRRGSRSSERRLRHGRLASRRSVEAHRKKRKRGRSCLRKHAKEKGESGPQLPGS